MIENISEEQIVKAYRAAIKYGPEPFNHENRAHHLMTSQMFDFLITMESSDIFTNKAYHIAGKFGIDICCVDWMQDVAEKTDNIVEFMDRLVDGYGNGSEPWSVYLTKKGEKVDGPYQEKSKAISQAGERQSKTGEMHHIVREYEK